MLWRNYWSKFPSDMLRAARALLPTLFGLTLFCIAIAVLARELRGHEPGEILATVRSIPRANVAGALALSILCYALLIAYDGLSLHLLRHRIGYGRIAFASFISYAFSNNLGLSALTGGSVRLRFYRGSSLTATDIVALTACCTLTFWLGFLAAAGTAFLLFPPDTVGVLPLPFNAARLVGAAFLAALFTYFFWSGVVRRPLVIGRWSIPEPPLKVSLLQTAVASAEMILVAGIIFFVLPDAPGFSFPRFLSLFLLAHIAGLASQVPGGIGVFESVMVELLPSSIPISSSIGALLTYRLLYNLLPLCVAGLLVVSEEVRERRRHLGILWRFLTGP